MPDSVVVLTSGRQLLTRSAAQLHLLDRLGGIWRILSRCARIIPPPLRDLVYRFIAAIRYRVFGREKELCPVMPPTMRQRFRD